MKQTWEDAVLAQDEHIERHAQCTELACMVQELLSDSSEHYPLKVQLCSFA